MSASQKAAVLFTGLICIGVIGYFFQQNQAPRPANPLTIAPQASDTTAGVSSADAPLSSPRSTDSQIGLADLVAQFADVYQHQRSAAQPSVADSTPAGNDAAAPSSGQLPEPAVRESGQARATASTVGQPLPPGTAVDLDHFDFDAGSGSVAASSSASVAPIAEAMPRTLTIGSPTAGPVTSVSHQPSNMTSVADASGSEGLRARVADMPMLTRVEVQPQSLAQGTQALEQMGSYIPPAQPDVLRSRDVAERPVQPLFETPPPAPVPTVQRTYTVQPGDTFSSIAVTLFGSEKRYLDIARANPEIDPQRMRPGQVLRLPGDAASSGAAGASGSRPATSRTASKAQFHIVGSGDNLSGIATDYYDDASKWREIYQANRDAIGPNPNRLKSGMKLVIPASD